MISNDLSGYKGDSTGKKLARIYLWGRIVDWLRAHDMGNSRIAFLASREGGDAAALKAMGWPAPQQLAIDRDPGALAAFTQRHPDVPTACGDAADVLTRIEGRFGAIYLDFCSPGTNQTLEVIARCVPKVLPNGRFAYCVMRGRERGQKVANIRAASMDRKAFGAEIAGQAGLDIETAIECASPRLLEATNRFTDGRSDLFEERVQKRLICLRIALRWMTFMTYHSHTADSVGVPMMIDDWIIDYLGRGISLRRFHDLRGRAAAQMFQLRQSGAVQMVLRSVFANTSADEALRGQFADIVTRPACNIDLHGATTGNLVQVADELDGEGYEASGALNVSRGTLAAWRAHHTQGRYPLGETVAL